MHDSVPVFAQKFWKEKYLSPVVKYLQAAIYLQLFSFRHAGIYFIIVYCESTMQLL